MTPTTMSGEPDGGTGGGSPEAERLQKYVARCGVTSRRGAEAMIAEGRVAVDGVTVTEAGIKVDPGRQTVTVDGVAIAPPSEHWYVMLNKPAGVVTTLDDPQGRPTVATFIPPGAPRMFPIGRLDAATTGLLLLTNDGALAHSLMHPRFHVPKVYIAEVDGVPDAADVRRLREGVDLDDGLTSPAGARTLAALPDGGARVELVLREGRKRQVRRMLSAVGHPVRTLERIGYGPLELGGLARGQTRILTPDEVAGLHAAAKGET